MLNTVIVSLQKNNLTPASNVLTAFENKVNTLLQSGKLTQEEATTLLNAADAIQASI
jgi:hypothetical protein